MLTLMVTDRGPSVTIGRTGAAGEPAVAAVGGRAQAHGALGGGAAPVMPGLGAAVAACGMLRPRPGRRTPLEVPSPAVPGGQRGARCESVLLTPGGRRCPARLRCWHVGSLATQPTHPRPQPTQHCDGGAPAAPAGLRCAWRHGVAGVLPHLPDWLYFPPCPGSSFPSRHASGSALLPRTQPRVFPLLNTDEDLNPRYS